MAADTYDSILGLLLQGTGNNNNAWGTNANASVFSPAARAIAGVNTISTTSGTVDLSGSAPPTALRQDVDYIQKMTGSLVGDLTIQVPNVSKTWIFWNQSSPAGHGVYVKVPGGVAPTTPTGLGGLVQIPGSKMILVVCDGAGNVKRHDDDEIGSFRLSAKAAVGTDELACDGSSVLRSLFPNLFAKIGTTWGSADGTHFTLPNLTDTNRFLRAGGGSGPAVGTYQANQNLAHSHTVTGAPTAGTLGTDSQGAHVHTITDPGHTHTQSISPTGGAPGGFVQANVSGVYASSGVNAFSNTTGISINSAGAHTHNITGAPGLGTLGTASSGGSEARPESAAVLICIRY